MLMWVGWWVVLVEGGGGFGEMFVWVSELGLERGSRCQVTVLGA